jgi:hypothetical protein
VRSDVSHRPVLDGDKVVCDDCGLTIAPDVGLAAAAAGLLLVDPGGLGAALVPDDPSSARAVSCTSQHAGTGPTFGACPECGGGGEVLDTSESVVSPSRTACGACKGVGTVAYTETGDVVALGADAPSAQAVRQAGLRPVDRQEQLAESIEKKAATLAYERWKATREILDPRLTAEEREAVKAKYGFDHTEEA